MGTSYAEQIPQIIHVVQQLRPQSVLDVGKGFGKYGMLLHEYVGLDISRRIEPSRSLKEQSRLNIDAVEVDADLLMPHLEHFYRHVYRGDVAAIQEELPRYDLVLMVDVIEHIPKATGERLLRYWLERNEPVLVSTPVAFFEQHLFQSPHEEHVSHWAASDFRRLGHTTFQYVGPSGLYLVAPKKLAIRGFGNGLVQRVRRCGRFIANELRW